jgi:hypothetical protein
MSSGQVVFAIWSALFALVGAVMALARTHPDQARSNFSAWAAWAGFYTMPAWLQGRSADQAAFRWASTAMVLLVGAAVGFGLRIWTTPISATSPEPAKTPTQNYAHGLSINHDSQGLTLVFTPSLTTQRLLICVDVWPDDGGRVPDRERLKIQDLNDVVKGVARSAALAVKRPLVQQDQQSRFVWNTEGNVYLGTALARVVIIGPDGGEQYEPFIVESRGRDELAVYGRPEIEEMQRWISEQLH